MPLPNHTLLKYLILILAILTMIACDLDGGNGNNLATPLPPDIPAWYTPVATADYH